MLGTDLMLACQRAGVEAIGLDLPELDVTRYDSVWAGVQACDWAINCAAYTNVDGAEQHRREAFAVNAAGARNVARVCVKKKVRLIHISTDYVFDGRRTRPYLERDQPNPLNVYGASKLAGEKAVRSEGGPFIILRTQSLFGLNGHSFVKAVMKRLVQDDITQPLRVVQDQASSPTYTVHLADAILRLLPVNRHGVVHVSASGQCSWYDFARAIARRVRPAAVIEPIRADELGRAAQRPPYSVLDGRRYRRWAGHAMPSWEEGLDEYLRGEGY